MYTQECSVLYVKVVVEVDIAWQPYQSMEFHDFDKI